MLRQDGPHHSTPVSSCEALEFTKYDRGHCVMKLLIERVKNATRDDAPFQQHRMPTLIKKQSLLRFWRALPAHVTLQKNESE